MNLWAPTYEYILWETSAGAGKGGTLQEQEAIRQCQAGAREALGVLFEIHNKAVFRTAYGIMREHDLAEDITQQVFIELFSSIRRYDSRRPFPPWLHRIAVNRSLDELRRHKKQNVPIEAVGDLPSRSMSPEEEAEGLGSTLDLRFLDGDRRGDRAFAERPDVVDGGTEFFGDRQRKAEPGLVLAGRCAAER